jgi:hypothetical protein
MSPALELKVRVPPIGKPVVVADWLAAAGADQAVTLQFGLFQVAPLPAPAQAWPRTYIVTPFETPVPSTQSWATGRSEYVAVVPALDSVAPMPRSVKARDALVTVTRPASDGGRSNRTRPRMTPPWPFCPRKNELLAPLLLPAWMLLMKVSAAGVNGCVAAQEAAAAHCQITDAIPNASRERHARRGRPLPELNALRPPARVARARP